MESIIQFLSKKKDPQALQNLSKKFSTIGITSDMVDSLADFNNAANLHMMPMYASIEFKTDGATKFLEALRSSGLDTALMKQIMRDDMANNLKSVAFHESEEKIVREEYDDREPKIKRAVLQKDKNRKTFDLLGVPIRIIFRKGNNPYVKK